MKNKPHPKSLPYDRLGFDLYVKKNKELSRIDKLAIDGLWESLVLDFRNKCKKLGLDLKLDVWITK